MPAPSGARGSSTSGRGHWASAHRSAAPASDGPPRWRETDAVPTTTPRDGYRSVTPRIVVDDVDAQVHFLRHVFDATGDVDPGRPAEIRIGDSMLMISSSIERSVFPAFLYVYVDDADAAFARAVEAGATVIEEPVDTPYGDRRAMVADPFGNVLQIAHPLPDR